MTAWATMRKAGFLKRSNDFGTTITFNGVTVQATATSKESSKELQRTSIFPKKPTVFTILREDFITLGVDIRNEIISEETTYEVVTINDDDADATVDLRCNKKV